jgi:hypothetical protein
MTFKLNLRIMSPRLLAMLPYTWTGIMAVIPSRAIFRVKSTVSIKSVSGSTSIKTMRQPCSAGAEALLI